jgi:benzodiazapine receptor
MNKALLLFSCIIIGYLPSLSAVFVGVGEWYQALNKPPLNPPNWIFGPAWTVLYLLIGISLFIFIRNSSGKPERQRGIAFFTVQHILNFSWTPLFFHFHSISGALAVILLMLVFIILTVMTFQKACRLSGILLLPYLAWVLFATYLNLLLLILNR